jgi:tRNA A37 threonylcarbamoyladenosine biosynthesis protein TsaE
MNIELQQAKLFIICDLYRLKSVQEALDAGWKIVFYSGNLCLVEWLRSCSIFPGKHAACTLKLQGMMKGN